ncbi:glycosyltransferase [Paracoccus sp. M683]|uniref:glycosyltransferase n=1 Tax=Paracoccus sp. M683 TaxID=2594268 RepID=UPI00117DD727|nr:glycosyltransferase [Paracoccus sp. M683]TRW94571.1 glycosyltransferase [Paracoccus sp. M683]
MLITNVDLRLHRDSLTRVQRAARADRKDVAAWELRQCPYEHPKYYDPVTLEAIWNSHACVLLRRTAYLDVGGYDDRIFMYGEDVELSYRFRGFGWRLRYLPQISVTHFVDLEDTSLRPLQLSGSLAANVLLRYRYGGDAAGAEGERLLAETLAVERNPARRAGMIEAQTRVIEHREHFRTTFKPTHAADFPFAGFDYVFARDGAAVAFDSVKPSGNEPKVSIVTRSHGPKTDILREALAAVINQSYQNIEHLIVEDRTDFARDIVVRAATAYGREIRYLKSDGSGRSAAGNFGLSAATGELMMFLDNDDLLFGDHVEILQRRLMAAPDLVAAYTLAWELRTRFEEDGTYREIAHMLPPGHRLPYDQKRLRDMNFIPIQAIIFRRSVFEAEGSFHADIDHLEDWNLWSRYSNHGEFGMIPKVTSMYRTPDHQETRDKRQRELDDAYNYVKALNAQRRKELA